MSRSAINFDSLREMHDSVNKLLDSPDTKLEIINHGHKKSAHEISEASLRLADSCAAIKDLLLLAKDHIHHLQSAFRRTATADHAGANFSPYRRPRKELKKAILKKMNSLKGMKNTSVDVPPPEDQNLKSVVDLLKEVRDTTLLIVRSLSSLIALPDRDGKPELVRKDHPVFRLKLRRVDSFSLWEKYDAADVRMAAKRLEEVEMVVEDMEAELERIFRRLIRTRAELLNILTT